MDKKECSPTLWGKLKKSLTLFFIMVFIYSNFGLCLAKDVSVGYKYQSTQIGNIGIAQKEDIISVAIDEYLDELEEKGYIIASHQLNEEMFCNLSIIRKSEINIEEIKERVSNSLDVEALLTKVKINNDDTDYYFKSEDDANDFINRLNNYIEQEYELESVIEDISIITSDDVLDQKERVVELAAAAEEAQDEIQVTSRSGLSVNTNTTVFPLESYSYISSSYGQRRSGTHTGIDYAAAAGTKVYAWKSGTVVTAGWNGSYGNFIEIQHNDGTVSRYAHLSGYAISTGQTVYAGQTIGYVGSTGNSTGPHLHFEIKINGDFVNPLNYLD